jgi:hypothetical protein
MIISAATPIRHCLVTRPSTMGYEASRRGMLHAPFIQIWVVVRPYVSSNDESRLMNHNGCERVCRTVPAYLICMECCGTILVKQPAIKRLEAVECNAVQCIVDTHTVNRSVITPMSAWLIH